MAPDTHGSTERGSAPDTAATCDGYDEWFPGNFASRCQLPPGHKTADSTFLGRSCRGNLPPNTCPHCRGKGTLPGNNAPVQGFSAPNCWHCNGQGVVVPPTQPEWAK